MSRRRSALSALPLLAALCLAAQVSLAAQEAQAPAEIVETDPKAGSEDFAYFLQRVPGAIVWLGTACPEYVNGTTLDVNNGSYPR